MSLQKKVLSGKIKNRSKKKLKRLNLKQTQQVSKKQKKINQLDEINAVAKNSQNVSETENPKETPVLGLSPALNLNEGSPFSALKGHVCEETLKAVEEMGLTKMTEIQAKAIPLLLEGRDIMASAKSGSDKTLAFLTPAIELIHKLKFKPKTGVGCIIISPSCELSMQTFGVLKELMVHHNYTYSLLIDGASRITEAQKLAKGINFIVATPGRLLDHLQNTPDFMYKNLQCLVIDEADKISEIGFEEDIKQIVNLLPSKRLTMLFSSSLTPKTEALASLAINTKPIHISVDKKTEVSTVEGLNLGYVVCPSEKRFHLLYTFLKKNRKKKVMVFFSSCLSVQFHHELFNYIDLNCMCIHGQQKQVVQSTTFSQFCNAADGILLCTDVAARGLDIPHLDWIVQYDPPDDPEEYIQLLGRTVQGRGDKVHSLLILRPEEQDFLPLLKEAHISLNKINFSWNKISDIQIQLQKIISENYFLNKSAKEAYKAYVNAYDSHLLKTIFNFSKLDLEKVAKSFGFTGPPAVDLQAFSSKNPRPHKRKGGGGFGFYNKMNRDEKQRPNIKYLQPKR